VAVLPDRKAVTALKEIFVIMIIWCVEWKENVSSVDLRVIPVALMGHVAKITSAIRMDSVVHVVGMVSRVVRVEPVRKAMLAGKMACAICVATLDRFVAQMDPVKADIYAAPIMSVFLAVFLISHVATEGAVMKEPFVARMAFVRLADMRVILVALEICAVSGMYVLPRDCVTFVES
jgi:hypothetical protein